MKFLLTITQLALAMALLMSVNADSSSSSSSSSTSSTTTEKPNLVRCWKGNNWCGLRSTRCTRVFGKIKCYTPRDFWWNTVERSTDTTRQSSTDKPAVTPKPVDPEETTTPKLILCWRGNNWCNLRNKQLRCKRVFGVLKCNR